MNCWHCNNELIWGGDHDTEDNEIMILLVIYLALNVIQQLMYGTRQKD